MSDYVAPLADMRFVLDEIAGIAAFEHLGFPHATGDVIDAVLAEAGRFAGTVLAPLNRSGDIEKSRLENGVVRTPAGFKDAYARFVAGGWNALSAPTEFGGQNLPQVLATAVTEMWTSANLAFSLCPMLTTGATELLRIHATPEQQRRYLGKLVSGAWTCAMALTEPQAGSDLGALTTRAVREGDHFRLVGQKIFITYGEHDWTDNIIHLVLARLADAPPGSRGISLFLAPKVLVNADGSLGARNDLRCVSLEHKLGIHASPTCVMAYGDAGGAVAECVGAENGGLAGMFTMMNHARLGVGLQGVAIAERAYQQARAFARQRVQGRPIDAAGTSALPILYHPDVRRMLLSLRAVAEAGRALAYYTAAATDRAHHHPDAATRLAQQARVDLLTPVVKAWSTDRGVEAASTNIQLHGGMGFIEETGAAQHLRDARIAPIYEGTNGIQANDLVARKLVRDGGSAVRALVAEMRASLDALAAAPDAAAALKPPLAAGVAALEQASAALLADFARAPGRALAGAVPYLALMGSVAGGWLMARSALAALRRLEEGRGDPAFCRAKLQTARFYAEQILAPAPALLPAITGGGTVMDFAPEQL